MIKFNIKDNKISEESFEKILELTSNYIFIKDIEGKFVFLNKSGRVFFNISENDFGLLENKDILNLDYYNNFLEDDKFVIDTLNEISVKEIVCKNDNLEYYLDLNKMPVFNKKNNLVGVVGIAKDVTESKVLKSKAEKQLTILNKILDSTYLYVYVKDSSGTYSYANSMFAKLINQNNKRIVGTNEDYIVSDMESETQKTDQRVLDENEPYSCREIIAKENGKKIYLWSTRIPFVAENGEKYLVCFSVSITKRIALEDELRETTCRDFVTKLYNREYFLQECLNEYVRNRRYNNSIGLILFDIDSFSKINERFGHKIGTKLLKEFAKKLKKYVRELDVLCRISDKEFAILAICSEKDYVLKLSNTIKQEIQNEYILKVNGEKIFITLSGGLSISFKEDLNHEAIYLRAEKALNKAKKDGKDKICVEFGVNDE